MLARDVGGQAGEGRPAGERGDVQDQPAALRAHHRQHQPGEPPGADDQGLQLVAELVVADLLDGAEHAVPGVVHQDVHPAETFHRSGDGLLALLGVADVQGQCEDPARVLADQLVQGLRPARGRQDPVPGLRRRPGQRPAQPGRTPRHQPMSCHAPCPRLLLIGSRDRTPSHPGGPSPSPSADRSEGARERDGLAVT